MGFPYTFLKVPKPFDMIKFVLNFLFHIRFIVTEAIIHLGLFNPPDQPHTTPSQSSNYILLSDPLCPSPIPVPVHVLTALIKKRLPVVTYSSFRCDRLREGRGDDDDHGGGLRLCVVCLDFVEEGDEIRELCNCWHVFHRECLDGWVDSEQVTCPSCRSMLFPCNTNTNGGFKGLSWMVSSDDSVMEPVS